MHLTHVAMSAAITVSAAGISYAALNPDRLERQAQEVADRATCRTVQTAIVAYLAERDRPPTTVRQLADYVDGDISAYRIVGGRAAGPGC